MTQRERGLPGVGQVLGNVLFGVLFDFRAPQLPDDAQSDWERAHLTRKVAASAFRWGSVSIVGTATGIVLWNVPALAPGVVMLWLVLVNRFVWGKGARPMPWKAPQVTRLGFTALAFSLFAPLVTVVCALLGVGGDVPRNIALVAAGLALLFALIDAPLTATEIRRLQVPAAVDTSDFDFIRDLIDMNDTAAQKGLTSGEFKVERVGDQIRAVLPPGFTKLIVNSAAIEATLHERRLDWEVAAVDATTRLLVLSPLTDERRAERAALDDSKGLFKTAFKSDEVEVQDLGIVWDDEPDDVPLPRL